MNSNYGRNYDYDDMGSLTIAQAPAETRASFLVKTYLHLIGAVLFFVMLEVLFFQSETMLELGVALLQSGRLAWLGIMVFFVGVATAANWLAHSDQSTPLQYLGLGLYAVAEALIFLPLLILAMAVAPEAIPQAGWATAIIFGLLTLAVFITRQDFSFLRTALVFGTFALIAICIAMAIFGFALSNLITWFGIALACGYILYDTSNVILYYRSGQHVAASLALFASVMLLFWYVLQLFISRRD
ncbi:MAG: Bax inhibitor-1 family protein [Thermoguttaceae bacterium]|nr:Bax inhibitor-1 family protein [Thermoguttaceae bacterium]